MDRIEKAIEFREGEMRKLMNDKVYLMVKVFTIMICSIILWFQCNLSSIRMLFLEIRTFLFKT